MPSIVAPSILAADLSNMQAELQSLEGSLAEWLHIDVMDGSFVPPITFGDNMVKLAKKHSSLYLDTHLMIDNPENHIEAFINAGTQNLTFHLEATNDVTAALKEIKNQGASAGLSIKPETPAEEAFQYLEHCDLFLVMTVNPGWGGQTFINDCLSKIKVLSDEISKQGLNCKIQVDGGINSKTGKLCYDAGAKILVAGSYIFGASDRAQQIKSLSFT